MRAQLRQAGPSLKKTKTQLNSASPEQAEHSSDAAEVATTMSDSSTRAPISLGRRAALGSVSAFLAACGGGGGADSGDPGSGGGGSGGGGASGTPILEDAGPVNSKRASRFLGQASMGATDADIARVLEIGYEGWLDEQMGISGNGSRYDWMNEQGFGAQTNIFTLRGSDESCWFKLFFSPDTLRQRISLALSEIFVINGKGLDAAGEFTGFGVASYMDMLERHAFGNYRELLEDVTLSHQMGAFLSLQGSRRADSEGRAPDENYAREILQLFSIGLYELNDDGTEKKGADGRSVETYSNDDIVGLARALTGWSNNAASQVPARWLTRMVLNSAYHETGEKSFLGMTVPPGTDGQSSMQIALDHIANHPNVGPFLGKQLIQRLVTSNPSSGYVSRVAQRFNDNGNGVRGDLGSVVKAVLLDPEALQKVLFDNTAGKIREPILRFAHWARSFEATSPNRSCEIANLAHPGLALGQSPMRSPGVFNFFRPGFVPPSTTLGAAGKVAPELQIANEVSVIGYVNFITNIVRSGLGGVTSVYTNELKLVNDVEQLVDRIDLLLTANELSEQARQLIVNTVSALPAETTEDLRVRANTAVLLVMVSADYLLQK